MTLEDGMSTQFDDDVDIMETPYAEGTNPTNLPFSFASEKGVLFKREKGEPCLYYKDSLELNTLVEVRRYIRDTFRTELLDDDEFQRQLTIHYQTKGGAAEQLAADFDDDIDLLRL
ncbi:MAG: hypothetical protein AAGF06_02505, partial [Pseudomonadota bacterium]